ncbi:MAG: hypothetical protein ABI134_09420, partial [Byssovorax sp.]
MPSGIQARSREDERLEFNARAGARIEAVAPANRAQLVAAELAKHGGKAIAHLDGELRDQAVLAARRCADFAAEKAAEIEEPGARDHGEHGGEGRRDDRALGGGDGGRRGSVFLVLLPRTPHCHFRLQRSPERGIAPRRRDPTSRAPA